MPRKNKSKVHIRQSIATAQKRTVLQSGQLHRQGAVWFKGTVCYKKKQKAGFLLFGYIDGHKTSKTKNRALAVSLLVLCSNHWNICTAWLQGQMSNSQGALPQAWPSPGWPRKGHGLCIYCNQSVKVAETLVWILAQYKNLQQQNQPDRLLPTTRLSISLFFNQNVVITEYIMYNVLGRAGLFFLTSRPCRNITSISRSPLWFATNIRMARHH